MLSKEIQKFLVEKINKLNLNKVELARDCGLSLTMIYPLLKAEKAHPELTTILKLAQYFKCSMNEVIGKDPVNIDPKQPYKILTKEEIGANIKKFIQEKIEKESLNISKLGLDIGYSREAINALFRQNSPSNVLGSGPAIALADHFKIPLDQLVGRVPPAKEKEMSTVNINDLPQILKSEKDLQASKVNPLFKGLTLELVNKAREIASDIQSSVLDTTKLERAKNNPKIKKSNLEILKEARAIIDSMNNVINNIKESNTNQIKPEGKKSFAETKQARRNKEKEKKDKKIERV